MIYNRSKFTREHTPSPHKQTPKNTSKLDTQNVFKDWHTSPLTVYFDEFNQPTNQSITIRGFNVGVDIWIHHDIQNVVTVLAGGNPKKLGGLDE